MTAPKAPITGITGRDGSYPAELLLSKGYAVLAREQFDLVAGTPFEDGLHATIDRYEAIEPPMARLSSV